MNHGYDRGYLLSVEMVIIQFYIIENVYYYYIKKVYENT